MGQELRGSSGWLKPLYHLFTLNVGAGSECLTAICKVRVFRVSARAFDPSPAGMDQDLRSQLCLQHQHLCCQVLRTVPCIMVVMSRGLHNCGSADVFSSMTSSSTGVLQCACSRICGCCAQHMHTTNHKTPTPALTSDTLPTARSSTACFAADPAPPLRCTKPTAGELSCSYVLHNSQTKSNCARAQPASQAGSCLRVCVECVVACLAQTQPYMPPTHHIRSAATKAATSRNTAPHASTCAITHPAAVHSCVTAST